MKPEKYSSDRECCKAFASGEETKSVYDAGIIKHSTSSDLSDFITTYHIIYSINNKQVFPKFI